jgi:acyl-CoA dehydrogenase
LLTFDLPDELQMLRGYLRRYVDTKMIPVEMDSVDGDEFRPGFQERFQNGMKELGIWMMDVPREFGGQELSLLGKSVVWSELGRTIATPGRDDGVTGPNVRSILYSLEGALREKYLLPVLRGEKKSCFAQTEPDAGSDPGGMRTSAVRDGDHYVINGVKRFITGAGKCDFMQLLAVTDKERGSRGGISCFIVDMDTPGVKLASRYETIMGDRPWEIVLEDVRVPATNIVGGEGKGFSLGQKWLGTGRVKLASRSLGVAERALELATSYAKQRVTFGKPLAERQGIQWQLADIYMNLEMGRLLTWRAATMMDEGRDARVEAYHCKYFCTDMAFKAVDFCMQIHGGIGLTRDLPIERMWRRQRGDLILEGANELMRTVIARHVLKTY